jgi:ribosomal protein L4
MKCALSARCNEGRIVVVDSLASVQRRPVGTRAMKPMITALMRGAGRTAGRGAAASGSSPAEASGPACRTALLVDCGVFGEDGGNALRKAAETISGVEVMGVDDVTVYHVLKYNVLVISKPALDRLSDQLASPRHRKRISARQRWWERELKEFAKAKEELCAS